jgi:pimeloyl-ACP methyl ester carboxylesterase
MLIETASGRTFAATGGRSFERTLPLIIFVHGAGMDGSVWAMQSRWFAHHGWNVLAVDLPGHGRSQGAALSSIEGLADWLLGTVEQLEAGPVSLVGHSMGSLVALEAAARYPEKVRSLGLIGAAAAIPVHADLLAAARDGADAALAMMTIWGYGSRACLGGSSTPGLWMVQGGRRLLERCSAEVLHADLAACDQYLAGPASATHVRCPARLVLGERDLMTPAKAGKALAGLIDEARVTVIPGAGHMLMIERPREVLQALNAPFQSHSG